MKSSLHLIHRNAPEVEGRIERLEKAGLVDYKICAVDATWSGLRFARRGTGSR